MISSANLRASVVLAVLTFAGCSSGKDAGSSGSSGSPGGGATSGAHSEGGSTATNGGNSGATSGGTGGAALGGSGSGGAAGAASGGTSGTATGGSGGTASGQLVYSISQMNGKTTASLANGVITVNNAYSTSGNAFKYVAPNYYGTNSNGFIAFPTTMDGDFSMSAEVTITTQLKANNACGIGLGMTTGFNGTDTYAYMLMRNSTNMTNGYYVNGAGSVSAGSPSVAFTDGTPLQLTFNRKGTQVTFGAGPVGGTVTTQSVATSSLTNGTTVYGSEPVYPAISFNNVAATISKLRIQDGGGVTVYDSDAGTLEMYVPASLTVSSPTAAVRKGATATVTATALAIGGAVSAVTATATDPTIVDVSVANGPTNATITLNGLKGGATTVTITNTADTNKLTSEKTLIVSVNDYPASDAYGDLTSAAYPAPGAVDAYADGELSLTFDDVPTLNLGGSIKIFKAADGTELDSVSFADETQVFGATAIRVDNQLVRVEDKTVHFRPHLGKLAYGTAYYVVIPVASITGSLKGQPFSGFSDAKSVATWSFTTRPAPSLNATAITVDGSRASTANFRTIQGALDAVATNLATAASVQINVAAGTYHELLRYQGTAGVGQTISIRGPAGNTRGDNCLVQWTNGNGMNGGTQTRASFYFTGASLVLENISFKNTGVRALVGQAETLYFAGGNAGTTLAAHNCSFSSNQDTLQTSGRNWFYDCYIEGNTDFIWGTADAALFESCDLRFINDVGGAASYSLFVARTGATIAATASGTVGKGYVLLDSKVSVDANVTAYFGRNAGLGAYYDQAALVNVTFDGAGMLGAGLWNTGTAPLSLGDSSYLGWKSAGCSGLNLATLTSAAGTSATIAAQATEYDTRDHILNRVVAVAMGVPSGYAPAASTWDVAPLATAWGAP